MEINLNEILINYYDSNTEQVLVVYDNKDNNYTFIFDNIPDKIKQMKIERIFVASENLLVLKVEDVIK